MRRMLGGFALLASLSEAGVATPVAGLEGVLGAVQSVVSSLPIAGGAGGDAVVGIDGTLNSVIVGTAGGLPITVPLIDGDLLAPPPNDVARGAEQGPPGLLPPPQ